MVALVADRRAGVRLGSVILLVLALTVGLPVPVAAEPRCDQARAMLTNGKLDDAQAAFTALAAFDTDQTLKQCGESGLVDVALARITQRPAPEPEPAACIKAKEFLGNGSLDAAEAVYRQLSVSTDAVLKKCGESGVADVVAQRAALVLAESDLCGEATSFLDENLEAAESLFKQLMAATNPQLKDCGERGLSAVAARRAKLDSAGPFDVLSRFWESRARPALPGLERVAAAALVFWAVLRFVTALGSVRFLPQVPTLVWWLVALFVAATVFVRWYTDGWGWMVPIALVLPLVVVLWHRAKRVTLQFGTIQNNKSSEVGSEVMAAAQAEFQALRNGPIRGVDVVAGTDQTSIPANAVADVAAGPVVKTLLTLLQALTPSVAYRLDGQLLAGGDDLGVAVSLRRGRRVVGATVIRRSQFLGSSEVAKKSPPLIARESPASPTGESTKQEQPAANSEASSASSRELSIAIAAWLLLTLGQRERWQLDGLYGATKWESVVAQVLGAEHRRRGEYDCARRLLAVAVDRDPKNLAARFDRASLTLAMVGSDKSDTAKASLKEVRDELTAISTKGAVLRGRALSYRLGYQRLVASLHLGLIESTQEEQREAFNEATTYGWQLLQALKEEDEQIVHGLTLVESAASFYEKSNNDAVEDFARQMGPTAILALAGAQLEASRV